MQQVSVGRPQKDSSYNDVSTMLKHELLFLCPALLLSLQNSSVDIRGCLSIDTYWQFINIDHW